MAAPNPLGITEVVLRDAHQSLLATRMRLDDMLPIAEKLDQVGYWSLESWGGATFDACIRFLGEDPWERIREIKKAMPRTPQQMLLRGQNILGYRHYADDLVDRFVERAAANGIDVFRIFDAMNDPRNLERAIRAVRREGKHAQGTLAYTVSPVHDVSTWSRMAGRLAEMGADSIAIKDMAGLLTPGTAFELVTELKKVVSLPIHLHSHATTGMSVATCLKAVEAGIDNVDTAISSMSMTYSHSPTETLVAVLGDTDRDTGLDIHLLEEISAWFREIRRKYSSFEGSLKGIDSRILVSQVPGGMLTNLENQLREQDAVDRFDEVLREIPEVRRDLGYIPLVTPTSQIVGTQAVLNVLAGDRYANITRETEGVLKGEYGATPAPVDPDLQRRVLAGGEPVVCRPADRLPPEFESLRKELLAAGEEQDLKFGECLDEDVLTYALFPQPALKFFAHRGDPGAFEKPPGNLSDNPGTVSGLSRSEDSGVYTVEVDGRAYTVRVSPGGDLEAVAERSGPDRAMASGDSISAPLSGNILHVLASPGKRIRAGDVVLVMEAMKMETEVHSGHDGVVREIRVREGDAVKAGDVLMRLE